MPKKTNIEWTQMTWNPVTGCTKVSQGCKFCYAERMAKRLKAMGCERYARGFSVTLHDDLVDLPRRWREPRTVFVNSMSDLFHEDIPVAFIQSVFKTMNECPQHVFQVLTKRAARLEELTDDLDWAPNIWMGVSVEDMRVAERVDHLRRIPAAVRFLSCEPLIGSLQELDITGMHWVIAGGESGPKARPMRPEWVREIRDECERAGIAFFFKQWGGVQKHRTGRLLDGQIHDALPVTLQIA